MSEPVRSLDRVTIPEPCSANWDEMIGNHQVRFCEHCSLHVTNLSGMTRSEAMRFVARSKGRMCVRIIHNADGGLLTTGAEKLHVIGRRVSRIAAGAFTAALSIANAAAQTPTQTSPLTQPISSGVQLIPPREVGAKISGTVTDPNGAVIAGAVVTLTNTKAQQAYIGSTNDEGAYVFSLLEPGKYTMKVESPGFASALLDALEFETESKITRNLELALPVLIEQVNIEPDKSVRVSTMGAVVFVEPKDPLALAAYREDVEAVKELVYVSLNINLRDEQSGMTPLEHAVEGGNVEIVRTLVLGGARADGKDDSGRTPLMRLGTKATGDLVRELLSAGAKVNERDKDGSTALMYAASANSPAVLKALIDNGAKLEFRDEDGKTALMLAAADGENGAAKAKLLIDAGALVNDNARDGKTPLMIAAEEGDAETVKLLLSYGAEVNERDHDRNSALMLVADTSDEESLRALLNAGADLTLKNSGGKTALAIAREGHHEEIIKLLESRGAPE